MTTGNYSHRVNQYLVISSLVLVLFGCSEPTDQGTAEPKPQVEQATGVGAETEPPVGPGVQESSEISHQARIQKDEAKADLLTAMEEARMGLKESERLLTQAPAGKDSDAPLAALEKELRAAENLLGNVRMTIDQGDYLKAKAQIQEISDRTNRVNQQIQQAIRKSQRGS